MFTLRQPDGPKGAARLRALPDGSVLFTRLNRGPNLWRLYPDGRATRLRWAGTVVALAAERAGTALVVREGRTVIERIHFGARRLSPVADLEGAPGLRRDVLGGGLLLVSGGDGTILVSVAGRLWRLPAGGRFERVAVPRRVMAITPLDGGAFVIMDIGGRGTRVAMDGRRRPFAPDWDLVGGAASFNGTSMAVNSRSLPTGRGAALTVVDADGTVTRHEWNDDTTLGRGDGAAVTGFRWPVPVSMTVATDGSLVFVAGRRIGPLSQATARGCASRSPRTAIARSATAGSATSPDEPGRSSSCSARNTELAETTEPPALRPAPTFADTHGGHGDARAHRPSRRPPIERGLKGDRDSRG